MKKTNYFSGMAVQPDDLLTSQSYLEKRIDTNMSAVGSKGVVIGATTQDSIELNPPYLTVDTNALNIFGLIAYDSYGRFIYVPPTFARIDTDGDGIPDTETYVPTLSNLKPDENNKLVQDGSGSYGISKTYLVVIRYAEEYDETTKRASVRGKNRGELYYTRIIPSFELYLRDGEENLLTGDVVLATVSTDDSGVVSVDETSRDTFELLTTLLRANMADEESASALGTNITFEDHINMVGSGTVARTNPHGISAEDLGIDTAATGKHQFSSHSDGIQTDDVKSLTSALKPDYTSSTRQSDEQVTIEPLTEDNNEVVIVNGTTLTPNDLGSRYVLDLINYASEEFEGYYILAVNDESRSITLNGPYDSETNTNYLDILTNRHYLPICSFYWGRPLYTYYDVTIESVADSSVVYSFSNIPSTREYYDANTPLGTDNRPTGRVKVSDFVVKHINEDTEITEGTIISGINTVTGDFDSTNTEQFWIKVKTIQLSDADRYDIDPLTWMDRRVFNNTGFNDFRREDLAAIRDAAPFSNNNITLYYARVESTNEVSYFQVGGETLVMSIDGQEFNYTFEGVNELSIDQLLSQLNNALSIQINSDVKPKAYINHNNHLTIVANETLTVGMGSANPALGFVAYTDYGDDIKTLMYDGDMDSIQEMYYDSVGNLVKVYYLTEGNYLRSHEISYNGDFVNRVKETVEVI